MIVKVIDSCKPVKGYVIERETDEYKALIKYKVKDHRYEPEVIALFHNDEFVEIETEEDLRNLLKDYIGPKDCVYIRKEEENIPLE